MSLEKIDKNFPLRTLIKESPLVMIKNILKMGILIIAGAIANSKDQQNYSFWVTLVPNSVDLSPKACGLYRQVLLGSDENYPISSLAKLHEIKSPPLF
jgi:hypothetical protein